MIYFNEDHCIPPPKKYKKTTIVLNIFLQIFLMSDLMEDLWIIIIASVFILIQSVACSLVEVNEEKQALHRHVIRKGRDILIAFLGNYDFLF